MAISIVLGVPARFDIDARLGEADGVFDDAAQRMDDLRHAADFERTIALRIDDDFGAQAFVRGNHFFQQGTRSARAGS